MCFSSPARMCRCNKIESFTLNFAINGHRLHTNTDCFWCPAENQTLAARPWSAASDGHSTERWRERWREMERENSQPGRLLCPLTLPKSFHEGTWIMWEEETKRCFSNDMFIFTHVLTTGKILHFQNGKKKKRSEKGERCCSCRRRKRSLWSRRRLCCWCSRVTTVCHVIYFWMLLHLFLSRSALGCSSLIHPVKSLLLSFSPPLFCPPQALAGSSSSLEHLYGLKNHQLVAKNVGEFCWIYCRSRIKRGGGLSVIPTAPTAQRLKEPSWRRIRTPLVVSQWGHLWRCNRQIQEHKLAVQSRPSWSSIDDSCIRTLLSPTSESRGQLKSWTWCLSCPASAAAAVSGVYRHSRGSSDHRMVKVLERSRRQSPDLRPIQNLKSC